MITPKLLSDLRTIMSILKEQATKYVGETTDKTTFGRFMIARLDTLNRIDVYITAASPGDSIGELRDSIGMIRDEKLAEIDGDETVETLAVYMTAKEFWDYLG
jgi:hypothetical protein